MNSPRTPSCTTTAPAGAGPSMPVAKIQSRSDSSSALSNVNPDWIEVEPGCMRRLVALGLAADQILLARSVSARGGRGDALQKFSDDRANLAVVGPVHSDQAAGP